MCPQGGRQIHGIHQDALLERKQLMQRRLVDIVIDLSLMALVVDYAKHLDKGTGTAYAQLADYFCREAKLRINNNFTQIKHNNDDLAGKILEQHRTGKYASLLTKNLAPADWLLVKHRSAHDADVELKHAKKFDAKEVFKD